MIEKKIVLNSHISSFMSHFPYKKGKSKLFSSIERNSISNGSDSWIAKFFSPKENKNLRSVESSCWISMSPKSNSFYLAF